MNDASLIRTILARECDTVNEYEQLAAQAKDPAVRSLILHFAEEEKEHIAECALALAKLDPPFKAFLDKPLSHVDPTWADDAVGPENQAVSTSNAGPEEADEPATTTPASPPPNSPPPNSPPPNSPPPNSPPPDTSGFTLASGVRLTRDPYAATIGSLFRSTKA